MVSKLELRILSLILSLVTAIVTVSSSYAVTTSKCSALLTEGFTPISSIYRKFEESEILVELRDYWPKGRFEDPSSVLQTIAHLKKFTGEKASTEVITFSGRHGYPETIAVSQRKEDWQLRSSVYTELSRHAEQNLAQIRVKLLDAVAFARENFRLRRSWPSSFLDKMDTVAQKSLFQSTYIIVRDNVSQDIIATIRIVHSPYLKFLDRVPDIHEPYYKELAKFESMNYPPKYYLNSLFSPSTFTENAVSPLPMERYLGSPVDRPFQVTHRISDRTQGLGIVYEPGLWAIRQDRNFEGTVETLLHLVSQIYDPSVTAEPMLSNSAKALYTYGDEVSMRLYGPLGFEKMHENPIVKDGINWWQLKLSATDAPGLIDRLQQLRKGKTANDLDEIRRALVGFSIHYQGGRPN